jgi:hypothetical protein
LYPSSYTHAYIKPEQIHKRKNKQTIKVQQDVLFQSKNCHRQCTEAFANPKLNIAAWKKLKHARGK